MKLARGLELFLWKWDNGGNNDDFLKSSVSRGRVGDRRRQNRRRLDGSLKSGGPGSASSSPATPAASSEATSEATTEREGNSGRCGCLLC